MPISIKSKAADLRRLREAFEAYESLRKELGVSEPNHQSFLDTRDNGNDVTVVADGLGGATVTEWDGELYNEEQTGVVSEKYFDTEDEADAYAEKLCGYDE